MKLARAVERRLERMLDGMAGRVFTGFVHPTEIAQRMVREADLGLLDHPTGPMAANSVVVTMNPNDLDLPPASLSRVLAEAYEAQAAEEGWRLPGPTYVNVRLDGEAPTGSIRCEFEVRKGNRHPWGHLTGPVNVALNNNRLWVGRSTECDVVLPHDEVSRVHAAIVRQHGSVWVTDLDSANGTVIGGTRVGSEPAELTPGTVIRFANRSFRLEIA